LALTRIDLQQTSLARNRHAANNKAKQSRDGAITVQVTHIEDLQE